MPTGPTGPGIKRGWVPSPAVVAQRLERMNRGRVAKRAEREAEARALGEELSGLSLDALRTRISTRYWTAAVYHVGGYSAVEIARVLGYAQVDSAMRVLKHPVVVRVIGLLREAQMQRVLRGEFGVAATAKAAAPQVMQHVVELAGAQKDEATGERVGRAKRDADAIRAAELTLTVSGHKVERTAHVHLHILEELSETELETLAERGEWPQRYRSVAGVVPGPREEP